MAAKDYVAADAAGYADGTDDVAGKADVAETMTCQRRGTICWCVRWHRCWRGDDMSRLIIFSAVAFLPFFLASLVSVTRCRRCRRWLTPCSCLGPSARGEEVVASGVAAGRGCWFGVAAGRGLLPKVRALWMVGCGWCWWLATLEPATESYGGCGAAGCWRQ